MGIFAFRRMREQEAANEVAPVLLTPKKKPKRKPKSNGNNNSHNSRKQHSE
jgi:hypothetical protein|tara:strand:+ start:447 stop:599 length:153 start_codon:yes stop_codon:yes gene_type:complete